MSNSSNRHCSKQMSKQQIGLQIPALVLVLCILGSTAVDSYAFGTLGSRSLSKRSFFDIQCKGKYDRGIYAKLNRVCDDCYNLYGDPHVHTLCSEKCFTSAIFLGCLDALTLSENEKEYKEMIRTINAFSNPLDGPID